MNTSANLDFTVPSEVLALIPDDPVCYSTAKLAYDHLEPAIFNHSLRVYAHAVKLLEREQVQQNFRLQTFFSTQSIDTKLLFIAAMCHDLGTAATYNGKHRFEVEGADAACAHMTAQGVNSEADLHRVWSAIALHTSSGIAERIDPFTRILRVAVKIDFSQSTREHFGAVQYAEAIERLLPRLDIERVLSEAVVAQAGKILDEGVKVDEYTWPDSEKHPKASWPGILLRAHLINPEFEGVNPAF